MSASTFACSVSLPTSAADLAREFVQFSLQSEVLKFGQFKTKAGRTSPYFFNAGLFHDGARLARLAQFYAARIVLAQRDASMTFDMLFGPAYKGIALVAAVAVALAQMGKNVPFAYNRKESKDHGEGGSLVGAPLMGRVLIVDDVVSAGTATVQSLTLIRDAGATAAGVCVALDRQEKAREGGVDVPYSATQYIARDLGLGVYAIATLKDLLGYLQSIEDPAIVAHRAAVQTYCERYGVEEALQMGQTGMRA